MIPEIPQLALFLAAAAALLLIPGPAVMYIVARSVQEGRAIGIASTLGIATGSLVHVGAAALGLSSILVKSALAYGALKYLGAAYLVFLGVRRLLARESGTIPAARTTAGGASGRAFRDGVVVNILNPKTALFFFAFLPQFVDVARGAVATQILFLGMLFIVIACVLIGYGNYKGEEQTTTAGDVPAETTGGPH